MAKRQPATKESTASATEADSPELRRIFAVLLESVEDAVMVFNRRLRVLFMNAACERLTGRSRGELTENRKNCGEQIGCRNEFGQSMASEKTCPVRRLFRSNSDAAINCEMIIRGKNDEEIWIESRYSPVRDASGQTAYVIGVLRDVSERKAMEEQLFESRKLASFGILTAGIAHELKNPLGIVRSAAEIVANPQATEAERREAAEFIKTETMRLDRIIRQFLAYARPNPPEMSESDLNEVAEYSVEVFRSRDDNPQALSIEARLEPNLPRCWIDASQIHQVVFNLLLNARDAAGPQGRIVVSTAQDGGWLTLAVADNGPGIEPELAQRVFDPFYTTKAEGAGLGLAVVRRIIMEHRGRITVERSPLGGASIIIRLPRHPSERPIPVEPDTVLPPLGMGSRAALRRRTKHKRQEP